MEVKVLGEHNFEITPALDEHARNHLDKFKKMMHDCNIEIRLSKKEHKHFGAKFQLHYKGHDLYVEKTGEDMYKVISEARESMLHSALKLKDKMQKH